MLNIADCTDKTDNELVLLSLKDSQYFYCLMKRYEEKLSSYVYHLTFLPEEDMADIIQNSFIKIYQHLNNYDNSLKFSSWVYRIAHNEAVNYLKKHRKLIKLEIEDDSNEFVDWLISDTDIEKEALESDFKKYIGKILDRLKPEYKEVIILRFFEEKDYQEISDILKRPMGTVATLLSRAKKQFKEVYEKNKKCQ